VGCRSRICLGFALGDLLRKFASLSNVRFVKTRYLLLVENESLSAQRNDVNQVAR
jgi:hypothetical protein